MMEKVFEIVKKNIIQASSVGAFHVFIGQFCSKFVTFFGSIVLVRILSKHDFGVLSYYENLFGYAIIFAGFGLSNAIIRYVVLGNDCQEKYTIFSYAIKKSLIIDIALVAILILICFVYPHPKEYEQYRVIMVYYACSLIFYDLYCCSMNNERAMYASKRYAYFSFFFSVSVVVTRIMGAKICNIVGVAIFQLINYCIWGIAGVLLEKIKYFINKKKIILTKQKKHEIGIYSVQYMITNGLWAIFMLNDVFMLGIFGVSASNIAEYKVAYALPANLSIIGTAIGIVVGPYFIKHENEKKWVRRNFKKVFVGSAVVNGVVAFLIGLFAQPLILILYGEKYINIVRLMQVLLFSGFVNSGVRYTFANLLAAMGKVKYNMIVAVTGIMIQILLNSVLIPRYGINGVAISSIFSYVIMASILAVVFYKLFLKEDCKGR